MTKKILQWSENYSPNRSCSYNHCFCETPFGRFLLTWKGWKEDWSSLGFDETPFGDDVWYDSWDSIEDAKEAAEKRFLQTIKSLLDQVEVND